MSNSKIGTTEAIILTLSIIAPFVVVSLPRVFVNEIKSGIFLNIIFITTLVLIFILLVCHLFKKFPGLDILDISEYLGGSIFKNIVGFIFILYFMISSSILLRNFCEGLKVVYYPYTNILFILLFFIMAIATSNHLGFNATIKSTTLFLPFLLISIILLFIENWGNFTVQKVFPILGDGPYQTFVLGLTNIGCFSGISYLYLLPPLLKNPENFKKISIISIIFTAIFILICSATLLFMFSLFVKTDGAMPLFTAARYIEFGTFFQRFESLFLLIWIISFCCYLSISCKMSNYVFKKIFHLEDASQITYIFSFLILGISLLPKDYATSNFFVINIYRFLSIALIYIIGFGILLLSNFKKKKVGE